MDSSFWVIAVASAVGFVVGIGVNRRRKEAPDEAARMLTAAFDATPSAIVLLGPLGRILYTNQAARSEFFEGKPPRDQNFLALITRAPAPFRAAVMGDDDAVFTIEHDDEVETYRLTKRYLTLSGETHTLLSVEPLTHELRRQEVSAWKKTIRIISHEINNSLAPVSSLVHSARIIVGSPEPKLDKLDRVFATIEERVKHLAAFLEGCARFAKLPPPEKTTVDFTRFLERIAELCPHVRVGVPPKTPGYFDAAQIEQVLLNVVKNAEEAGSAPDAITLDASGVEHGVQLVVRDRGSGMSDEVLKNALRPFYSTKGRGSGIGLSLCREVLEAHGGKIRIANRDDGQGLVVTCALPGRERPALPVISRLTLGN